MSNAECHCCKNLLNSECKIFHKYQLRQLHLFWSQDLHLPTECLDCWDMTSAPSKLSFCLIVFQFFLAQWPSFSVITRNIKEILNTYSTVTWIGSKRGDLIARRAWLEHVQEWAFFSVLLHLLMSRKMPVKKITTLSLSHSSMLLKAIT